jgi:O-antigen ligase
MRYIALVIFFVLIVMYAKFLLWMISIVGLIPVLVAAFLVVGFGWLIAYRLSRDQRHPSSSHSWRSISRSPH